MAQKEPYPQELVKRIHNAYPKNEFERIHELLETERTDGVDIDLCTELRRIKLITMDPQAVIQLMVGGKTKKLLALAKMADIRAQLDKDFVEFAKNRYVQ
jgi:hypothetical protein